MKPGIPTPQCHLLDYLSFVFQALKFKTIGVPGRLSQLNLDFGSGHDLMICTGCEACLRFLLFCSLYPTLPSLQCVHNAVRRRRGRLGGREGGKGRRKEGRREGRNSKRLKLPKFQILSQGQEVNLLHLLIHSNNVRITTITT